MSDAVYVPVVVGVWTGREVRALRTALRHSQRHFAELLGVSDRMIAKWESAGASLIPRPVNQAVLDTMLSFAGEVERQRFRQLAHGGLGGPG